MNQEVECSRPYKIMVGDVVTIIRSDFKGYTFYKIKFFKRSADGMGVEGYKNVKFPKGVDIDNGTKIRIIDMFEDFYNKDKFTTIWTLFIQEFEIVNEEQSYEDYATAIDNANSDYDELPF